MDDMYTVVIVTDNTVLTWLCFGTAEEAEEEAKAFAEVQQLPNPVFVTKHGFITF